MQGAQEGLTRKGLQSPVRTVVRGAPLKSAHFREKARHRVNRQGVPPSKGPGGFRASPARAAVLRLSEVTGRGVAVTAATIARLRHPLRGYSSTSFAWAIARRWAKIRKPIVVYYVGDHDPSGRDIERSVIWRCQRVLPQGIRLAPPARRAAWSPTAAVPMSWQPITLDSRPVSWAYFSGQPSACAARPDATVPVNARTRMPAGVLSFRRSGIWPGPSPGCRSN